MLRWLRCSQQFFTLIGLCVASLAFATESARANPALEGYANHETFTKQLVELDQSDLVQMSSLGKSVGGRDVWLLTIGAGKVDEKPAIVVVGNVNGAHLVGGELALRVARQLVAKAATDEKIRKLLDERTFYFIPRPDPDGCEKCFVKPFRHSAGNDRKTDDDRDFSFGEDPPDDLNGDGWITMLRVADENGTHFPHPDDPRVLIAADAKKNERGQFRLLVEGRDNDGDEQFNEDAADGVAFNKNFPFRYPAFQAHAGANAVSEPECRAVADFLHGRPNIAIVYCFSLDENLVQTWKPNSDKEKARIKTSVLTSDAASLEYLAGEYRKIAGGAEGPGGGDGAGSFSHWAYFHYGRWSLASRGWTVPKVEPAEVKPAADAGAEKKTDAAPAKRTDEKRGGDELNALRWFAQQGLDGFAAWTPIEHPDFPGKKVEVGGFKPFYQLNPPAKELDGLAEKQGTFLAALPQWLPQVAITETKAENLGGGVFRISATCVNRGFLPTMSEMGQVNGEAYPLQIQLNLPKVAQLLQGPARSKLARLEGGGQTKRTWLVRFAAEKPAAVEIRVWAPAVGSATSSVELK